MLIPSGWGIRKASEVNEKILFFLKLWRKDKDRFLQETKIKAFIENELTGFAAYVFETPSGDGVVSFGKTENSFKCVSPRLPPIKVSGKQGKEVKPNDGIFSIVA